MTHRNRPPLASFVLLLALFGCAAPTTHYRTSYATQTPVPEVYHAAMLDHIEEVLKSGKVRSLSADTGAGQRPVYPQPKDERMPLLDLLPLPAVVAVEMTLYGGTRGAEWDQLIPQQSGRLVPVTVTWELDGHMAVRVGPELPQEVAVPSAEEVRAAHGVILEDTDRQWTPAQLRVLDLALRQLSPEERGLLSRVTFRRRALSQCSDKKASGCYISDGQQRAIEIYDSAFIADPYSFVGDTQAPLPSSVATVLHEIGHAIDGGARAEIMRLFDEALTDYNALVERMNGIRDRARSLTAQLNGPADHTALRMEHAALEQEREGKDRRTEELRQRLRQARQRSGVLREYERARGLSKGPTEYGRKDLKESFAESFALFRADPQALRRVYPGVHAWFEAGGHLQALQREVAAPVAPPPALAARR